MQQGRLVVPRSVCNAAGLPARRTPGTANGAAEPTPNYFTQAHIDFASKAFIDYQQKYVGDIYFAEDVEIGSKEWVTLIEEIFAYITGDIHSGDPKGEVRAFLRDYEAVKNAWEELIKDQTPAVQEQSRNYLSEEEDNDLKGIQAGADRTSGEYQPESSKARDSTNNGRGEREDHRRSRKTKAWGNLSAKKRLGIVNAVSSHISDSKNYAEIRHYLATIIGKPVADMNLQDKQTAIEMLTQDLYESITNLGNTRPYLEQRWSLLGNIRPIIEAIYGDDVQFQQRTDTLTDRDVLAIAKRDGLTETLSKKDQNVAGILLKRGEALGNLQEQKAEQERILEKLQEKSPKNHTEITKAKNRIKIYEDQIAKASAELRELESMENAKVLLETVRPAVERKLIAERKAELAKYGTIPQGEKAVRKSDLPKSTDGENKVSKTARTVYEAGVTPEDFAELIDKEVYLKNGLSYIPVSNSDATQKAIDTITEEGWEAARGAWSRQVRAGKVNAELSAIGSLLLNDAAKAGDKQTWLDVLHDYQYMGTNAAQGLQATRILKKLSPDDSLYMMKRSVSQMVEDMHLQDVYIDPVLEREYLEATTDTAREKARRKLTKHIAMQIPATFLDRWRSLRYVNMLGNFRTQVRNVTGNMGMIAITEMKNLVATGIEQIASLASGGRYSRTTAVFVGKELMKSSKEDFGNVEAIVLGGGKYADETAETTAFSKDVMDQRKIFKLKPLEGYRKLTNWAMEQGDLVFSKHAYAIALGRYLKAHGVKSGDLSKVDPVLMEEARLHAVKEAQETTFRDTNTLSGWISKIGRRKDTPKVVKVLSEGILPFRKTPANILVRAEEYSPLGIINSVVLSVQSMQKDSRVTGDQVVNSWAKTLTGTGLFLFGMLLQGLGLLTGGPDDDEGQDQFESLYGWQNYAITLPDGTNLTIDFLSPAAMSLFMGAQLNKIRQDGDVKLKELERAITSIADPMVEMSMLQGVNDTLENIQYVEDNLGQFAINAAMSYFTQGLTNTMLGQIERSLETERVTTYVDKESSLPNWLQRQLGKMSAKTPIWDYNQVPYINVWGEEELYPGTMANMAQNMLLPSFVDKGAADAVYEELMRLNEVQSTNVFPKTPEKTVSFTDKNGVEFENYNLTADEYVVLAKAKGQTQRKVIEDMVSNRDYQNLSDEDKVKAIRFAYTYANEKAMIDVLNAEGFRAKWRQQIKGNVAQAIIQHVLEQ